jgi:hypothetical protein
MKRQIMVCTLGASTLALILMTAPANAHTSGRLVSQPLSSNEVKPLTRHASSPEEFQKLATYFDQRAHLLDLKAQEHDERADHDASTPGIQPKAPYAGGWISHCRYLASEYRLEAQKAREKAQHYKALSKGSGGSNVHFKAVA